MKDVMALKWAIQYRVNNYAKDEHGEYRLFSTKKQAQNMIDWLPVSNAKPVRVRVHISTWG